MNFKKKIGNVFMSKFVGTGPSSYKKRIYRAAVSQRLRNIGLHSALWSLVYTTAITSLSKFIHNCFIENGGRIQCLCMMTGPHILPYSKQRPLQ